MGGLYKRNSNTMVDRARCGAKLWHGFPQEDDTGSHAGGGGAGGHAGTQLRHRKDTAEQRQLTRRDACI